MNCMKCGAELRENGVFCEVCLAEMEKYPVSPNVTVQIPRRPAASPSKKKSRRQRYVKPEDQIRHLKRVRNALLVLLTASLAAFAICAYLVLHLLEHQQLPDIGQNYGTVETTGN